MKLVATLSPVDRHGCRDVRLQVESGGHMPTTDTYEAGTLYLREPHVEMILRRLEGASGGFMGDLEVRHAASPAAAAPAAAERA